MDIFPNNKQKELRSDFESYIDEKFNEISKIVNENHNEYMKKTEQLDKTITNITSGLNQLLSDMREELEDVKNIANEKEARIKRYEDGYDYKILKDFTKELIKITEYADSKQKDFDREEIYEELTILLENEGIEKIELKEGDKYNGNEKIAKIKNTEFTQDKLKNNTIKEIVRDGYYICITEDKKKVLKPTEVIIYKYKNIEKKSSNVDEEVNRNISYKPDTIKEVKLLPKTTIKGDEK